MYQKEAYQKNNTKILIELIKGEKDFQELKDAVGLSSPSLSLHLKDLYERKVIDFKRDGKRKIYFLKESAYKEQGVRFYLLGLFSAFKVMRESKRFWSDTGRVAIELFMIDPDCAISFLSSISKYKPVFSEVKTEISIKNIIEEIYLKMMDDYNQLIQMKESISEIESRGISPEKLKKKFESRFKDLKDIYISLGPPFSYRWLNIVEKIEY